MAARPHPGADPQCLDQGASAPDAQREGPALIDRRAFGWLTVAAALLAAGGAIHYLLDQRWLDAAALGAIALFGALAAERKWLPSLLALLLVLAGLVNVLGYVLTLWHEQTSFDEIVHAFTSFAGCSAVTWLVIGRTAALGVGHPTAIVLVSAAIGLVLGLSWEAFEWSIGIIGDARDTWMDLAMDMIGALSAGLLCAWAAARKEDGAG